MRKTIYFIASLAAAMTFAQTGNVGVRTAEPGSTLTVNGSFAGAFRVVTGFAYTMTADDHFIVCQPAFGATAVTLPSAQAIGTGNFKGRLYYIKNGTSANGVGVYAATGESIHTSGTLNPILLTVEPGDGVLLISNGNTSGTTWEVVSYHRSEKDAPYTAANGLSLAGKEVQLGGTLIKNTLIAQGTNTMAFTSAATTGTSHFTIDANTFNVDALTNRVGIGTNNPLSTFQVLGIEARVGGPSTQTGTLPNPILRIHSNANLDGNGGRIFFNEDSVQFGYYIQHNSQPGPVWGEDALTFGAFGGGTHAFTPDHPGLSINARQNVGIGTNWAMTKFHIDGAEDNNINVAPTPIQAINDVTVTALGRMGVGTISPISKLEVNGAITNTSSYNAGASANPMLIDFANSNLAYTSASPGVFTLSNIKDGGSYTLSVRGTTSGTSTFSAGVFAVKYVNNGPTVAGKETLYHLTVIGTTVYVNMLSGF